jgi:hypothetical protein
MRNPGPDAYPHTVTSLHSHTVTALRDQGYDKITFVKVRKKRCRNPGKGGHSLRKSGDEGSRGTKGIGDGVGIM